MIEGPRGKEAHSIMLRIGLPPPLVARSIMRVVITGGAGFLGRRAAEKILDIGHLTDARGNVREIRELVLLDVAAPNIDDPRVSVVTGDVADPALIASAVT